MAKMPTSMKVHVEYGIPWEPLHEANQPPIDAGVILVGWSPSNSVSTESDSRVVKRRRIALAKVTKDGAVVPANVPRGIGWAIYPDYWALVEPPEDFGKNPGDIPWLPDHEVELKRIVPEGHRVTHIQVKPDSGSEAFLLWRIHLHVVDENGSKHEHAVKTYDENLLNALITKYAEDFRGKKIR